LVKVPLLGLLIAVRGPLVEALRTPGQQPTKLGNASAPVNSTAAQVRKEPETRARVALQVSYTRPDPTSLGIIDAGTRELSRALQEHQEAASARKTFSVPWYGWVIFALLLTLLGVIGLGLGIAISVYILGTALPWRRNEAAKLKEAAKEVDEGGGLGVRDWASSAVQGVATRFGRGSRGEDGTTPAQAAQARDRNAVGLLPGGSCMPCLTDQCGNLFTKAVRRTINSVDKKVLGVSVSTGNVRVNPRSGLVEVQDIILDNPEGYYSEYLVKIKKLTLQISMAKYIFSRGKTVIVESLDVSDVEIIYERALTTSNIDYVIHCMNNETPEETVTGALLGTATAAVGAASAAVGAAGASASAAVGSSLQPDMGSGHGPTDSQIPPLSKRLMHPEGVGVFVPRMARSSLRLVKDTAGGVVETATNVVGTAACAGASAVTGAAMAVETGINTGARGILSGGRAIADTTTAAVGSAACAVGLYTADPEADEAEIVAEVSTPKRKNKATQGLRVKRLSIRNVGMVLASNMLAGKGLRVVCGDITYEDFTNEVAMNSGLDIVRFLLKSTLLSALKSVSSLGDFTLETTSRCLQLGRTVADEVKHGAAMAVTMM